MKLNNQIAGSMGSYLHFRDLGWEPVLKGIAGAGFKNVELSASYEWQSHIVVEEITNKDIELLRELLGKYGLTAISMSAHSDLTCSEGFEAFKRRMDLAIELGVGILVTGTGKWSNGKDLDNLYRHVDEISNYATKHDLLVTLETHGNGFTGESHTASGKMYLPIIKNIDRNNIRICYDTANVVFYEGVRPEEDILYVAEYLGYLHLKDKRLLRGVLNFPAIGQGNIYFPKIFDIIRTAGYSGPFSIEIEMSPPTPPAKLDIADFDEAHKESYRYLKDYFSSL